MNKHIFSFYLGLFIVFGSHLYMLLKPDSPIMSMKAHAYFNIFAGLLLIYYFLYMQKYIAF